MEPSLPNQTASFRRRIAATVRALRKERAWTQAELAGRLGLSQSRLSEIETGDGSFTAEQFLRLLQLFNVTTSRFTGQTPDDEAQLRNGLARLGAHHLQESTEVVPASDVDDLAAVVRDALVSGDPRLTTGLAPVLVANIHQLSLGKLFLDLARIGLERRLVWLAENTVDAIRRELTASPLPPRAWALNARHAAVVLQAFVDSVAGDEERRGGRDGGRAPDLLDASIRSKKTLEEVTAASTSLSRQWGIVTALSPIDFQQALRGARVAHP
jgi:transcriptional regulator with XRE-family HTH domain